MPEIVSFGWIVAGFAVAVGIEPACAAVPCRL
jgi:hypothetical protein